MLAVSTSRTKAFISYSPKDAQYLERLQDHLTPYVRTQQIEVWDDTKIKPGLNSREEIAQAIAATKVAVLLISANFLASEYIAEQELPALLKAAKHDGAIILCVILSPSAFIHTDLRQFHPINAPDHPLIDMSEAQQEAVWQRVAELIRNALHPKQSMPAQRPLGPLTALPLPGWEPASQSSSRLSDVLARMIGRRRSEQPPAAGQLLLTFQELRLYEKQVKELKTIHHLLHCLETDLDGIVSLIRIAAARRRRLNIGLIEDSWKTSVSRRIWEMEDFATHDMHVLEPPFEIAPIGKVTGPPWMTHVYLLKGQFEESLHERNSDEIAQISGAMLDACREHLFHIDKELLKAADNLDRLTDHILRSMGDDAGVS